MPAPGEASVPNGRSPLSAKTSSAGGDEHAAGDMISAEDHALAGTLRRPGVRSSSHLADRLDGGLDALGVLVPELGEVGLVEIGDDVADVVDRLLELLGVGGLLGSPSRSLSTIASGVPLGANRPTQSENSTS